jgi:hypothetical protein
MIGLATKRFVKSNDSRNSYRTVDFQKFAHMWFFEFPRDISEGDLESANIMTSDSDAGTLPVPLYRFPMSILHISSEATTLS